MSDFDRFIPWKRRKCKYCGYPLAEKYKFVATASGREKKIYCCNICCGLYRH